MDGLSIPQVSDVSQPVRRVSSVPSATASVSPEPSSPERFDSLTCDELDALVRTTSYHTALGSASTAGLFSTPRVAPVNLGIHRFGVLWRGGYSSIPETPRIARDIVFLPYQSPSPDSAAAFGPIEKPPFIKQTSLV